MFGLLWLFLWSKGDKASQSKSARRSSGLFAWRHLIVLRLCSPEYRSEHFVWGDRQLMRLFYRTQNSFFQIVHILKSSFLKDSDHFFHWLKYGDWSPFLPRPASSTANARAGQLLWLSSAFLMHAVILLLLWDRLSLLVQLSSSSFSTYTFALLWL